MSVDVIKLSEPYNLDKLNAKFDRKEFKKKAFQGLAFFAVGILIIQIGEWLNVWKIGSGEHTVRLTHIIGFVLALGGLNSIPAAYRTIREETNRLTAQYHRDYLNSVVFAAVKKLPEYKDWPTDFFNTLTYTGEAGMWSRVRYDSELGLVRTMKLDGNLLHLETKMQTAQPASA